MNASKQRGIYNPIYPVLKECLERNRENILKKPGVTGVGIGYKVTGGKETDQLAVVICVKEKRPEQELASDAILPKAFEQQKTDVRQLSLVEPPGFWGAEEQPDVTEDVEEQQIQSKPATDLRGGDSIGGPTYGGTLGFFFQRKSTNELGVTSNAHVFSSKQQYATVPTGGATGNRIGKITIRYLPPTKKGDTDGAFVTLDDQKGPSEYKLENGTSVKGTGTANIKDEVMYYGAKSEGVVTGVVTFVDFTAGPYKSGYTFTNQIVLDNSASAKPGMGGDSGALIVRTTDNLAVGVEMAGGKDDKGTPFSICNPIASFMTDLGITLVPTP